MQAPRPYYHQFAWAYDLLQTDPVEPRVDFIAAILRKYEIARDAALLDAGCGTGRYAAELARRGFVVCGVDRSRELIAVGRSRAAIAEPRLRFLDADLLDASFPAPFDAILCRGVLNDFVEDTARTAIFRQFSAWLGPGGVLIFDVREWSKTVERYSRDHVHRRRVELPNGNLRFHSETTVDAAERRMLIREHFDLEQDGKALSIENDFVMRCWTPDEIAGHLRAAGLRQLETFPGYGDDAWTDRLVVVAGR